MLRAIAELGGADPQRLNLRTVSEPPTLDAAERRKLTMMFLAGSAVATGGTSIG